MRVRGLGLVAALAAAGCASDKFFVLVSVEPAEGEIANVSQLLVDLEMGTRRDLLTYPKQPGMPFKLEVGKPVTFSIGLDRSGTIRVGVEPIDANGQPLAYGTETVTVAGSGGTVRTKVAVVRGMKRPDAPDAGAANLDAGDVRRPDPLDALTCDPMSRACGPNQTCSVGCRGDAAVMTCGQAGQTKTGEICTLAGGCAPGNQCFPTGCKDSSGKDFSTCLQYCRVDADCGQGAVCSTTVTVPCGAMRADLKLCSRPCDPVGTAENGCARGLHCFLFDREVTDCACRGTRRTALDGATCMQVDDCAPGLMCIFDATNRGTCRPLCRLSTPSCAPGRTCTVLRSPDLKIYGACLPP